jgi:hypothetical protein
MNRIEVITSIERRRRWSRAEKEHAAEAAKAHAEHHASSKK